MKLPPLLVVAGGPRHVASTRHRLWAYRPFLERDGVDVAWLEYGGGRVGSPVAANWLRARFVAGLARWVRGRPVVLVQKVLPPRALVRLWRARGCRVVYDFDDALHESFWGETAAHAARRKARLDGVLELASHVTTGSPPLAAYARTRAASVDVLYPSLPRDLFDALPRPLRDPAHPVLGWIGNDQSQIYLKALDPVLADLFRDHPGARLRVCTSHPPELSPAVRERLDFVRWSERAEIESAAAFDVAISPLGTDQWSRARGGRVSVLLSMGAGVPVVAAPGGGVEELVRGSEGVLFATSPEEWGEHLRRLLASPGERARRGAAARAVIDREIWADVQYPRFRRAVFGEGAG